MNRRTNRQTNGQKDGQIDLKTESAQRADTVKIGVGIEADLQLNLGFKSEKNLFTDVGFRLKSGF